MAPKPKLTIEQIGGIRARKAADPSITQEALAREFGVGRTTITAALAGAQQIAALIEGVTPPHVPSSIVDLELGLIIASPLNPRHTFDDATIAELAESIAASGLMQNLVVRKTQGDTYEIVDGERRYRALMHLANHSRWAAPVPCRIIEADDAQHIALALLANLQREDVPPLEEADAFAQLAALAPEVWTTAHIAAQIGRSVRYVQQRLAMAKNLVEPAKVLLRHGKLTLEGARLLAAESEAVQMEILTDYDLDQIKDSAFEEGADVDLDDLDLPTETIEDCLLRIQRRQAREKEDAARAAAPPPQSKMQLDQPARETSERTVIDKPATLSPDAVDETQPDEPAGAAPTKSHIHHAHRRKSIALQNAVVESPLAAMRLACLALLGPSATVFIRPSYPECAEDQTVSDATQNANIAKIIDGLLNGVEPPMYVGDTENELALWHHLLGLLPGDLTELFNALVAQRVHTPAGHQTVLGDSPFVIALADSLNLRGNEAAEGLSLQEADLAGLPKPTLLKIAGETATPLVTTATKKAEIAERILKHRTQLDYVIPTLRFATTKQIETMLAAAAK